MIQADAMELAWLIAYSAVIISSIGCAAITIYYERKIRNLHK